MDACTFPDFILPRKNNFNYTTDNMNDGSLVAKQTIRVPIPFDEFRIWKQSIEPLLTGLNEDSEEVLEYALTEILNNAQDHSNGKNVSVSISQNDIFTKIRIGDDGTGIFTHIMDYLQLEKALDAAIELAKGKFTTQPERHSGEGLFFTAKAVDKITICANAHCLEFSSTEVLFTVSEEMIGTEVTVQLNKTTNCSLEKVFEAYCQPGKDDIPTFNRTVFKLQLAQSEGRLVSRSQAKRIMHGMERFNFVEIDFTNVENIGQGFADEMFRVWPSFHQDTDIKAINSCSKVGKLISRVTQK